MTTADWLIEAFQQDDVTAPTPADPACAAVYQVATTAQGVIDRIPAHRWRDYNNNVHALIQAEIMMALSSSYYTHQIDIAAWHTYTNMLHRLLEEPARLPKAERAAGIQRLHAIEQLFLWLLYHEQVTSIIKTMEQMYMHHTVTRGTRLTRAQQHMVSANWFLTTVATVFQQKQVAAPWAWQEPMVIRDLHAALSQDGILLAVCQQVVT